MVAGWDVSLEESMRGMLPKMARSIAGKKLPPVPAGLAGVKDEKGKPPTSIMLFYQYVEPAWTAKQHRRALAFVHELGRKHGVTGRGRCSAEGLNCTLTGTAEGVRAFAQGLRDWDSLFDDTDFKITDGLDHHKKFKSLTIQKKEELVAYGLPVSSAPSLKSNETKHIEADDYHKMMSEPNTVIIDVRNRYETEIGHFQPPPGGAEFVDPKVRNSHELPKWLGLPETQDMLKGKKVMMYCTGGIRCERFSALMSQLKQDKPEFETEGEFMLRGGIERYVRTFPEGGYWKGKNFLFDKRQEQIPEKKPSEETEKEVESRCCVCKRIWGLYRGQFKCSVQDCQVPVIVCPDCRSEIETGQKVPELQCPLCEEGFRLRDLHTPALKPAEKRKAASAPAGVAERAVKRRAKHQGKAPSQRLFVGSMPLAVDATMVRDALGKGVEIVQWIHDKTTGLWYGSSFVKMATLSDAERVVEAAGSLRIGKRKLRINFAPVPDGESWPPPGFEQVERPPVPV
ncbi:STR6 [Symbiodinium sp. CCMP2592]|nr:STR6 [Symbiodinium sp. CCMP2592]